MRKQPPYSPILTLENVSVRKDQTMALSNVSFELGTGQHWAVIGGNGAGKSTFLSLVRGDIWPTQNMGRRLYIDTNGKTSLSPIGFREFTTTVSAELIDHYLLLDRVLNGKTLLMTGLHNTPLIYTRPTEQEWERVYELAGTMGVTELLDKPLPECSSGQIKRLFLARAMACNPKVLFLDEYVDALDRPSRLEVMSRIDQMADNGVQILCATHRATELPDCINRILLLEKGKVLHTGVRTIKGKDCLKGSCDEPEDVEPLDNTALNPDAITQTAAMDFSLLPPARKTDEKAPVIALKNATAGIVTHTTLTINKGERWIFTGANGAGKSTLLRMIAGELPAALGGEVRWFGQERIPSGGEYKNFWDIKQRIGMVTPRLQTLHRMEIAVQDVMLSGFWQHVGLYKTPTQAMEKIALETLSALGIANLAERNANTLSYGQLRKVIIARALVNSPSLLILDEPFSGLDAPSRKDLRTILNGLADQDLTMILATHHPEETEDWATNKAVIADGIVTVE
ncbi:ATP-binding cassette domain-containing protein [Halodesulfovibrio sp.]|uniref:ATP-binding cassette domain-containing protein n=1 Tax=Halodesulfovibrio sp. TaxID=1912772 RepID=UPI0025C4B0E3|nr:ATP-binding cassette domain-containing protein [Halodesulfovibrio sp.]